MSKKLPPLNSLKLFEAAGRLLNFKLAAEETHVTPSAVSHSIRTLEDWLGTELFHRTRTGLSLTKAGADYLPSVQDALAKLARATAKVPGRVPRGELKISVAPTFASRWLMPRLHRFTQTMPDTLVTIDTSQEVMATPSDEIDLAIRMATASRPGASWLKLTDVNLVPVCTPEFLQQLPTRNGAFDLRNVPFIRVTTTSEDWDAWFQMRGTSPLSSKGDLRVDTIELAIQAALRGLGIMLGRKPLIDTELSSGRLVELLGPPIMGKISYWLVGSELTMERPEAKYFRRWLLDELEDAGRTTGSLSYPVALGRRPPERTQPAG